MSSVRRRGDRWQVVRSVYVDGRRRQTVRTFVTEAEARAVVDAERRPRPSKPNPGVVPDPWVRIRFDVGPLRPILRRLVLVDARPDVGEATILASLAGVHRAAGHRWIERGWLGELAADRVACAVGRHPAELWPEWWSVAELPPMGGIEEAA